MADTMVDIKGMVKDAEGKLVEKVIARQLLIPADVPKFNPPWVSDRENYLFSKGWERENSLTGGLPTYKDPRGSRLNGEIKKIRDLPNAGPGGVKDEMNPTRPLYQLILSPGIHSYMLEEAVAMQTRRDQEGEDGATPLERLEAAEIRCNLAEDDMRRVRATIKGLLINTGLTIQGIRLGLRQMFGWDNTEPDEWKI